MSGFFGREGLGLCLVPLVENSYVGGHSVTVTICIPLDKRC